MSAELSLKDLKAILEDNNIDLSMRQLVSIPAKALSKIPRATHLDFSNNLITLIPPDFCLLAHVTKLDLSNNHITHLPEEFGKMSNLVHLDLYRNEIEDLPLSFGELTSLKWLDLKGNPLELDLLHAAGDCLDEKGCKTAALNVVRFMRDRSAKQQQLLEKQKSIRKELGNGDAINHDSIVQKEKTKKKKNKHQALVNEHLETVTEDVLQNKHLPVLRKDEKPSHQMKRNEKNNSNKRQSFFYKLTFIWWKILTILFVLALALSMSAVFMVMASCFSDPQHWFLSSKPFCEDLQTVLTEYSFPQAIFGNLLHSLTSLLNSYANAAGVAWQEFARMNDSVASVKDSFNEIYIKLISLGLLVQGYAMHKYDSFMVFYNAYAADFVNNTVTDVWLLLRIFGLMAADLLMFIVGEGFLLISSSVETIFTYAYRADQLAEVLLDWWKEMK